MARAADEIALAGCQSGDVEVGIAGDGSDVTDDDVQFPPAQQGQQVEDAVHDDLHLHIRAQPDQGRDGVAHHHPRRIRAGTHTEHAAAAALQGFHLPPEVLGPGQHLRGPVQQQPAHVGGLDATGSPVEQADAGLALELFTTGVVTVRFEGRNVMAVQEAVAETRFTNNLVATFGLSLWVPTWL